MHPIKISGRQRTSRSLTEPSPSLFISLGFGLSVFCHQELSALKTEKVREEKEENGLATLLNDYKTLLQYTELDRLKIKMG